MRCWSAVIASCALAACRSHASEVSMSGGPVRGVRFDDEADLQLRIREGARHLAEWKAAGLRGADVGGATCNNVMSLPTACNDSCNNWCWNAIGAMAANYYKNQSLCGKLQCQMASLEFGEQCCPDSKSCLGTAADEPSACNSGATPQQMADAATRFAGGPFKVYGPLSKGDLDSALNRGHVVMLAVFWRGGGGHALMVGGCAGTGYWVHDPWAWYSPEQTPPQWQNKSYSDLVEFHAPNGGVGLWVYSIMWSLDDEAGHASALKLRADDSSLVV